VSIHSKRRTTNENLFIVAISLIPMLLVIEMIYDKRMRSTMIGFAAWLIAICMGNVAWRILSIDDPPEPDCEEGQKVNWKDTNWGTMLASCIIGLTVFVFIMWLPHMGDF
jgi:hypothetical protein